MVPEAATLLHVLLPLELSVGRPIRLPLTMPLLVPLLLVALFHVAQLRRKLTNLSSTNLSSSTWHLRPRPLLMLSVAHDGRLLELQLGAAARAAPQAATALTTLVRPLALLLELLVWLPNPRCCHVLFCAASCFRSPFSACAKETKLGTSSQRLHSRA